MSAFQLEAGDTGQAMLPIAVPVSAIAQHIRVNGEGVQPLERTLYQFVAYDSHKRLTTSCRVGWWSGRHWVATFGDGMWSPDYVIDWWPLEVN